MGIDCLTVKFLIDILCLDCGFLNARVHLLFTSSYEGVYLKAESSNKNRIRIPGGQVKPNLICLRDRSLFMPGGGVWRNFALP